MAPSREDGGESQSKPWHFDAGKSRVDLIPPDVLLEVGDVFRYGEEKYGPRNWEIYSGRWDYGALVGSTLRHILAWMGREELDPESQLHHLAHAVTNLVMLRSLVRVGQGEDDRSILGSRRIS